MVGQIISHYRIVEKLGEGGMGAVYKAEDQRLKRTVALKFLLAENFEDAEQKDRFIREAQTTAALDHPGICTIYEIGEDDSQIFISMPFIYGSTLKEKIEAGPLELDEMLDISLKAARALEAAHRKNVVHCDISGTNIMITDDGQVKIMDFGLARIAGGPDGHAGRIFGTLHYMSPEQVRGEPLDQRTDIWSLGICMYEMLAGRLPFAGDYGPAIFYSIGNESPPCLCELKPDVPVVLERVVEKAIAKDVTERFQTVSEMIERLECARKEIVEGASAQLALEKDVPPAVAVLPFVNMSADKDQDYFCYGIAEEIINGLTQVEGLRVVARTSAFAFKGKTGDVREIGQKLNVSAVLEGSVRKSGNKLRITAQLINVADGFHLWSDRYDRELEDVFAIQDDISQSIVRMLKVKLIGEPEQAIVKRYTRNFEAYTLYLKGRFYWSKRSEDSLRKGMEYFEMAIEEDPDYALAYAGLADSFNLLGFYNVEPPEDVFPKAIAAANKAIAMDDSLAEPYTSLAFARMLYEWDWEGAERAFKRSLELNPDYPTGNHWYAEYLVFTGQTEAVIVQAARTLETDPLSLIINTLLGWVPYFARQYGEAVEQYKKALEMDAEFVPAHFFLGLAYALQSKYEKALTELQLASKLFGRSTLFMQTQAYTLGLSGRRYEAEIILKELENVAGKEYVSPYFTAVAYAGLGDMDRVFEWLARACEQRDIWMVFLKVDPIWDDLRPDPMFAALLERVGLGA